MGKVIKKDMDIIFIILYTLAACFPAYLYMKRNGPDLKLAIILYTASIVVMFIYYSLKSKNIKTSIIKAIAISAIIAFVVVFLIPMIFAFIWTMTPSQK
jgi:membrane protease YdiL (CAAX protease family)